MNIRPISDLRNHYSSVEQDVVEHGPVFLTKNGRGKYAILDMKDFEKTQAALHLMSELAKGRKSGERPFMTFTTVKGQKASTP